MVCNFPGILAGYAKNGWHAKYFAPAHDPVLDEYAGNQERPVDVLFVGGFSRHHQRRAKLLRRWQCADKLNVVMHLDQSRLARFAASPLGRLLPLAQQRVPAAVRRVSRPSVYRARHVWRCRGLR